MTQSPSHCTIPSGQEESLCNNAVHQLQLSLRRHRALGLNPALCNWVLDFLMDRPQVVKVGNNTFAILILTMGVHAQPPCVLPIHPELRAFSNSIIKMADDTTVVGLITNNDDTAYRD